MADARDAPARIKEVIASMSDRFGLASSLQAARIFRAWPEIAGEAMARHAEPTSLRDGVLRVRTDSPTWATEISYLRAEIAARTNALLGGNVVRDVRVWTSPGPVTASDRQTPSSPRARPPEAAPDGDPVAALQRVRRAWSRARSGSR